MLHNLRIERNQPMFARKFSIHWLRKVNEIGSSLPQYLAYRSHSPIFKGYGIEFLDLHNTPP